MISIAGPSLNLAEIEALWKQYMSESSALTLFRHFTATVEDQEIRSFLEEARSLSERHMGYLSEILSSEGFPPPEGFSPEDVYEGAPRLFTDAYYLHYLHNLASFGLEGYSQVLRYITRSDIREYFSRCSLEARDLHMKVVDMEVKKKLYSEVPTIGMVKKPLFPDDDAIFRGILVDNPRPLYAIEATDIYGASLMDRFLKATAAGFAQTAEHRSVREFMAKGRDLAAEHFDSFTSKLIKEGLEPSYSPEALVTASEIPPFSDKLMMYYIQQLLTYVLMVDGSAITFGLRSDIVSLFARYGIHVARYAKEGLKIMLRHKWFEQPPQLVRNE